MADIGIPPRKCEICGVAEAKYCCPGCSQRSCSVGCVKAHKLKYDCDGKRKRSEFVQLDQMSDETLWKDVEFLSETEKVAVKSSHDLQSNSARGFNILPARFRFLLSQARRRDINLKFMSEGLHRHTINTSNFNSKSRCILWRIELVFFGTTAVVNLDKQTDKVSLRSVVNRVLDELENQTLRHQLASFCDPQIQPHLILSYKIPFRPANAERYISLAPDQPLSEALRGLTVIEFPTIVVIKPNDASKVVLLTDEEQEQVRDEYLRTRKKRRVLVQEIPSTSANTEEPEQARVFKEETPNDDDCDEDDQVSTAHPIAQAIAEQEVNQAIEEDDIVHVDHAELASILAAAVSGDLVVSQ